MITPAVSDGLASSLTVVCVYHPEQTLASYKQALKLITNISMFSHSLSLPLYAGFLPGTHILMHKLVISTR